MRFYLKDFELLGETFLTISANLRASIIKIINITNTKKSQDNQAVKIGALAL